jgi:hypothetical protein
MDPVYVCKQKEKEKKREKECTPEKMMKEKEIKKEQKEIKRLRGEK